MTTLMRAAVFHGRGDIRVEQVPRPEPGPGELLVKVGAVGVCGTDVHEFRDGPVQFPVAARHPVTGHRGPLIPGHEPAGVVVATAADVDGFTPGDAVASGATTPCGRCEYCGRGRTSICRDVTAVGVHRHGALGEYATLPARTCRRLEPYGLSVETGALAQPMAIAAHAVARARLRVGEHVTVIGVGGVGAFVCHAAVTAGARLVALDRHDVRLELARRLGAADVVRPETAEGIAGRADVVVETTGTQAGLDTALAAVADGGRVLQLGLHHGARRVEPLRLTLKELELVGSNSLSLHPDLHVALELLAARPEGWADVAPVLLPLDQLVEGALAPMADGSAERVKTMIDPWARTERRLPRRG